MPWHRSLNPRTSRFKKCNPSPRRSLPRPHSRFHDRIPRGRRTEPVYLPENHFPRPELRRPGLSATHRTRGEQPLGRAFWAVLVMLVIALAIILYVFWLAPRIAALQVKGHPVADASSAPTDDARPVTIVQVRAANPVTELPVTGTVQPARETALYARTTGYVKDWKADIGDRVQTDQVLAELDTPDVDHQLVEARATADQSKAALALAPERGRSLGIHVARSLRFAGRCRREDRRAERREGELQRRTGCGGAASRHRDVQGNPRAYAGTVTSRNLEVGALVGVGPGRRARNFFA